GEFGLHIRLYTLPEILGQPKDQAVPEQADATFQVGALGARPLRYQWQFQRTNTVGFVDIPGATSETLVRRAVTLDGDSGLYRCRVANHLGEVVSLDAALSVLQPPVPVEQPKGGTASSCTDWVVSARFVGGQPLSYQWRWRASPTAAWVDLEDESARTPRLTLFDLSLANSGQYQVWVTNAAGQAFSDIAELAVRPVTPKIDPQPKDDLGLVGEALLLVSGATGCRVTGYQWYFRPLGSAPGSAVPLAGQTGPDLFIEPVALSDAGFYSMEAVDEEGPSTRSREAQIRVEFRPPNDPFERAYDVTDGAVFGANGFSYRTNAFNTHGTTQLPEEPNHLGAAPIHSVWWRFQTNAAGVANVSIQATPRFPSRLVVYSGSSLDALTLVKSHATAVAFVVEADVPYHIVVDGANAAAQGPFLFQFDFATQGPCPEWVDHPQSFETVGDYRATGLSCRTNTLSGEVSSITPVRYQWLHDGVPVPGATSRFLTFEKTSVEDGGAYQLVAMNDCAIATTSRVAQVVVRALPRILVQPTWTGAAGSQPFSLCTTARVEVLAESCSDLTYQWRKDGIPMPGAVAPELPDLILSPALAGAYDVVVANRNGAVTSAVAVLQVDTMPAIRATPEKATHELCGLVTLAYDPKGCVDATYQWRRDGVPIPLATDPSLELGPLLVEDAGVYDLQVTVGLDTFTTKEINLVIDSVPDITRQPARLTVDECSGAEFCVQAAASPCAPLGFQWFRKLANEAAFTPVPGATQVCLNLTNVSILDQGGYLVEISNGLNLVRSAPADLVVNARPQILTQPANRRVRVGTGFTNEFSATSCRPLTYHWFHNGQPVVEGPRHRILPGGALAILASTADDGGNYHAIASNAVAGAQSRTAIVRVVTPPPNDPFSGRITLVGTNVTANSFSDGGRYHNEMASRESGEPVHAGVRANRSVWWTWTAPTPGLVTIDVSGSRRIDPETGNPTSALETLVGIYLGEAVDQLRSWTSGVSRVTFPAAKGRTFQIAVDGRGDMEGQIEIRLSEEEIISPPIILEQPVSLAATNGETVAFSVKAYGSPDLIYQWTKNGADIPGATNETLVLDNVQPSDEANYVARVSNEYPPSTNSFIGRLTFGAIIRGQVTDATNDKPIPGAKVYVPGYEPTFTNADGNYELVGIEPNELSADFWTNKRVVGLDEPVQFNDSSRANSVVLRCEKRPEYIDFEDSQFQPVRGLSVTNKISMSPVLTAFRFVLNWGRNPPDLDATLLIHTAEGRRHEVNYLWVNNGLGRIDLSPYTTFDKDVVNGFGPETITVHRTLPGAYRLYISKASGALPLPDSEASVRVYQHDDTLDDNRHLGTVTIAKEDADRFPPGAPFYWHVCDLDGYSTNIVWVNRITTNRLDLLSPHLEPPSAAGAPPVVLPPVNNRPNPNAPDLIYSWDLGGGRQSNLRQPTNLFSAPGCYDVGLTVSFNRAGKSLTNSVWRECYLTVTNGPPGVRIDFPSDRRIQRVGDPIVFDVAAWDTDRIASARRVSKVELFEIRNGASNLVLALSGDASGLLNPAATNRYRGAATGLVVATPGIHRFMARATDNHGAISWSDPVSLDLRELDGEILVIRNRADSEIDCLTNLLTDLDFRIPFPPRDTGDEEERGWDNPVVRVLDQEGLHFDLVRGFRLIIWDDTGDDSQGITANDVEVLLEAWNHGIPLYFIGENLVSDGLRLGDEASRVAWSELIRMVPGTGTVSAGMVALGESVPDELFNSSRHGLVEPFVISSPLQHVTVAGDGAESRATLGGADVLVRVPPRDRVATLEARRLAQSFLVCSGDDSDSLGQRRTLLWNGVLWLLRNECNYFGATLQCETEKVFCRAGEEIVLESIMSFTGACLVTGTVVTNSVPAGFEILGAEIAFTNAVWDVGGVGEVSIRPDLVRFGMSRLQSGTHANMRIRAVPRYGGTYKVEVRSVMNYRIIEPCFMEIEVDGPPPELPSLQVGMVGGRFEVRLDGQPPCDVVLEISEDLQTWRLFGENYRVGPGSTEFPPIEALALPTAVFFRARCAGEDSP
ncbi:MAG: immunoglobulin domain-containing protein, partial [Limisphaerales bacterium]